MRSFIGHVQLWVRVSWEWCYAFETQDERETESIIDAISNCGGIRVSVGGVGWTHLDFCDGWADLVGLLALVLAALEVGAIAGEEIDDRLDCAGCSGMGGGRAALRAGIRVGILYPELEAAT